MGVWPKCQLNLDNCAYLPDPLKTTQGYLSLKAYRLTPDMMKFYGSKDQDFTADAIKVKL